jgi:Na+/H+ antiporter NhaA
VTDPAPDHGVYRNAEKAETVDTAGSAQSGQTEPSAGPEQPVSVGSTAWFRQGTALRRFLRAEAGSGAVLLVAAVVALIWVNIDQSSYDQVWHTRLSIQMGHSNVSFDLRGWINSGLMSFFFLVVGLEARREFDIGEFRDRPRAILPVLAGVGGMLGAIGLYLAINAGRASVHDWGVAMSTDTAFALGVLAVLGSRVPDRLRGFVLTVTVVDDIVGLVVIATVYTHHITVAPLLVALGLIAVMVFAARRRVPYGLVYFVLAATAWVAMVKSGVDPIVVGLAVGLTTYAAPAARPDLERATDLFRDFREQPTPELASSAGAGLRRALSPNDRLQQLYHPWTGYLIVPLFGLANAGIPISPGFLAHAYSSPITLGIMAGYIIGKPLGVTTTAALVTKGTRGRLSPPVGWAAALGGGTIAGVGFTVSLLVASVAFTGQELQEATLGVLTATVASALMTWTLFFLSGRLPTPRRAQALLGRSETIVDLADPVDPGRDHIRGPADASVTLVEYGDLECPYCGQAEPIIRELLTDFGNLRYVWRHLPLSDVHPQAQLAAEASEAAAAQGAFWPMHDLLLEHQDHLGPKDLVSYARQLGLDVQQFADDLRNHKWSERVAADVETADLSGVAGTPTFFINGQRQIGPYDITTLRQAVQTAAARAVIVAPTP